MIRSQLLYIIEQEVMDDNTKFVEVSLLKYATMTKANRTYAKSCSSQDIVAIMDTSVFGSGKTGFLLSENALYSSYWDIPLKFQRIKDFELKKNRLYVTDYDGVTTRFYCSIYAELMARVVRRIVDFYQNANLSEEDYPNMYNTAIDYLEKQQIEKANDIFMLLAHKGYAPAQLSLAISYEKGRGFPQNRTLAIEWYKNSAENKNAYAQYYLGRSYLHGDGIEENHSKAIEWLTKASIGGDVNGQFLLAIQYYFGKTVDKNVQKAFYWFEQAAQANHPNALYNVALLLRDGEGTTQNLEKALEWAKKAQANQAKNSEELISSILNAMEEKKKQRLAKMSVSQFIQELLTNDTEIKFEKPSSTNVSQLKTFMYKYAQHVMLEDVLGFIDLSTSDQVEGIIITKDAIYSNFMRIIDYCLPVVGIKEYTITYDAQALRIVYYCQAKYEVEMTGHIHLITRIMQTMLKAYDKKEPKKCYRVKESQCEIHLLPAKRFNKMPVHILICGSDTKAHESMLTLVSKYAQKADAQVDKQMTIQTHDKFDFVHYKIVYKSISYIFHMVNLPSNGQDISLDAAFQAAMKQSQHNGFINEIDPFDAYIYIESRFDYTSKDALIKKFIPDFAVPLAFYLNKYGLTQYFESDFQDKIKYYQSLSQNKIPLAIGCLDGILEGDDTYQKEFMSYQYTKDLIIDFNVFLKAMKKKMENEILLAKFVKQTILNHSHLQFQDKEIYDTKTIRNIMNDFERILKRKDILLFKDCSIAHDGSVGVIVTKNKVYSQLIENQQRCFFLEPDMQVTYDHVSQQLHIQYSSCLKVDIVIKANHAVFEEVIVCYQEAYHELQCCI